MFGLQDYDSDLDFEIEPFPSVSNESLNEAAACVKVSPLVVERFFFPLVIMCF